MEAPGHRLVRIAARGPRDNGAMGHPGRSHQVVVVRGHAVPAVAVEVEPHAGEGTPVAAITSRSSSDRTGTCALRRQRKVTDEPGHVDLAIVSGAAAPPTPRPRTSLTRRTRPPPARSRCRECGPGVVDGRSHRQAKATVAATWVEPTYASDLSVRYRRCTRWGRRAEGTPSWRGCARSCGFAGAAGDSRPPTTQ
jgi:hypothetical protein